MADARPRIFIASTFADLQTYREVVRDAVLKAGAVPVMLESTEADERHIGSLTASEIGKSDAIVFVVGHRYGQTDSRTGKSWVETEYEVATKEKKPRIVFVAADDMPWPPALIDANRRDIETFRRRLVSDQPVKSFSSLQDLHVAVLHSLTNWVDARNTPKPQTVPSRREVKIIQLLLSSPGDVGEERDGVARAVFRFNQHAVEESGLFIKLVRWEDMAPQIGPKAQAVINKQIVRYHIFCGIMWNRFGTPTDFAASGTKEEFDGAVQCWNANNRPWITFYFCDRPVTFTTPEQLEQKRLVLSFREQLHNMGVVRAFQTASEFEDKLFDDLKRIVKLPEFLRMLDEE